MRRFGLALTGLVAAAGLAQTAPPQAAPASAPLPTEGARPSDHYFEVIEPVAPGVWVVRQGHPFHPQPIGNVTVIEQRDGLVLIDSGGSPGSGRRIAKLIKSVSAKPVKAVALTHWHGDHPLGLPGLIESWPKLKVIATVQTRDHLLGKQMERYAKGAPDNVKTAAFLKSQDETIAILAKRVDNPKLTQAERDGFAATVRELTSYKADSDDLYVVAPTIAFPDRLVLADRSHPVILFHPGRANTDGDLAAWLPRQHVLASGDIVVAPIPFGFNSYAAEWEAVLGKLRAYPFRVLIPGHGYPQRDKTYLDRMIALIADGRAQVAALAARHLTLDEARKQVDLSKHRQLFAGNDPWLRRWFDRYWIDPFVEGAWKEATGMPIEQGGG